MPIEKCILPEPIQAERAKGDEKAHFELIRGMITSIVAATLPYENRVCILNCRRELCV